MKLFVITAFTLSLNSFAQTTLDQKELCGQANYENKVIYDYNYRMGRATDQAGSGSCYAFSVAALLEEDLYLRKIGKVPNSTFENNISVIDIQRCDMEAGHGLGYVGSDGLENDYAFYTMECALYDGGACYDKYSPFETGSSFSLTTQYGRFQDFMSIYDEWQSSTKTTDLLSEKTYYFWDYLPKDTNDALIGNGYSFAHFAHAFYSAKNRLDFLNKVLTTKNCEKNRFQFENRSYITDNYYQRNYSTKIPYRKEKMDLIKKIFSSNRSALLILSGPTHAAVVTGMRMQDGVCQLYLRSSLADWGSVFTEKWFTGWINAETVVTDTISIKYLKETTAEDYQKSKEAFSRKDIKKSYEEEKPYTSADKW